jgi:hypothetical protein
MSRVIQSSPFRYIFESAVSEVLEEVIPVFYSGHKQIFVPIIVDIRKGSRHTNLTAQAHSGLFRDVFKTATAHVAPKLVATKLVHEINVVQAVASHVGHRDSIAVVIMISLIVFLGIIDNGILEGDSTFRQPVNKPEVVIGLVLERQFLLRLLPAPEPFNFRLGAGLL